MKITFKFPEFHQLQKEIYASTARYKVLCCGRRLGKSLYITAVSLETALKGGQVAIIAPIYRIAKEISFEKYLIPWVKTINKELEKRNQEQLEIDLSDLQIKTPSGGNIYIRSADKPDNLRSQDYDLVIFDEAAFQPNLENLWEKIVRPTLIDRIGKAYFISTPNGFNYFNNLFQKELTDDNWKSWNASSYENPHLSAKEIDDLKKDMTPLAIEQEIYAKFTSDGQLFRKIDQAFTNQIPHQRDQNIVVGADFGRSNDSTVLFAMDKNSNTVIAGLRLTDMPFEEQEKQIELFLETHQPELIVMESNSFGKAITERFINKGYPIEEFTTTNASKKEIIDRLVIAFEDESIKINEDIDFSEIIKGELNNFQVKYTDTTTRYGASSGHDDAVIALALTLYSSKSANDFFITLIR